MSGTTGAQWWKSDPLASDAAPPSPASVDGGWWKSDPMASPGEIAPEMGNIIDDPARAAPAGVIANASMFPNAKDRIPVYAKALGIPPSEFGTMGDVIVYRDPKDENRFIRVEPSVTGATGVADAAKRVGLYAAGSVGPAIPAVAGIIGGALTRSPAASIAAAGAGGGAGDVLRQAAGQFINGGDPSQIDWLNVAGQTALGASGQGGGVAGRAMFNKVPAGLAAADQEWMRNPANVAAARENADLLRQQGITAMNGPITDRGSLIAADRQMMRNANTADPMRATVRRINTDEVPGAVDRVAGQIYPNEGVDVTARRLQEAARVVIESPRKEVNLASRDLYRQAQATPDQWAPELDRLLQNKEMQGLYNAAATRAERDVTMGTPGAVSLPPLAKIGTATPPRVSTLPGGGTIPGTPPVTPPFEAWQYMRRELDARAEAARVARDFNTERQMKGLSDMLDESLKRVNPSYDAAQAVNRPGQQITARLNEGVLGGIAKTNPDAPAHQILAKAFSPSHTTPAAIAESRTAFMNAGQVDAWDSALSGYIRNVSDTAQKSLANGETGNVAGKIHAELFGTGTKREAMAAAMGGKNTPAYKQFAETMRALEIAARVPAMGSQTATDLGQVGAVAGPTARGASGLLKAVGTAISPLNWGAQLGRLGDRITDSSASKAALATANRYKLGPALNGAALDAVRVMHPTLYGLLSGASRAGVGILPGLLGAAQPAADWQPYQPLRPGP